MRHLCRVFDHCLLSLEVEKQQAKRWSAACLGCSEPNKGVIQRCRVDTGGGRQRNACCDHGIDTMRYRSNLDLIVPPVGWEDETIQFHMYSKV